MGVRLAQMTWDEARQAIADGRAVILPTGATEAHGAHLPLDTDTHQADHVAVRLAERVGALVAPAIPYAVSNTFEHFAGTVSLSVPTYQQVVYEVGAALIRQGVAHLVILNGNLPNGSSNDAVARRLVADLDRYFAFKISVVSYWEPGAAAIHAARRSQTGGMCHGGEFETAFQLAVRPELVKMERLGDVKPPLGRVDLVAPSSPTRTYGRRPEPETNPSIFGDPHLATPETGARFLDLAIEALAKEIFGQAI